MKTRALLLSALLLAPAVQATVTLQFSSFANRASNFLSSTGASTTQMVWGIVVDADNNGYSSEEYIAGFSYAGGTVVIPLETRSGPSDDLLVLSGNLMAVINPPLSDSTQFGMTAITNLVSIPFGPTMGTGDGFRIIWFDHIATSGTSQVGTAYGMLAIPGAVLPNDGDTVSFAPFFAGPDPAKPMAFALVPEPSHALLGLCGLALLFPRRRTAA